MTRVLLAALFLAVAIPSASAAPLLDRLEVRATGPVQVTVPLQNAPQSPIFQAADGAFLPLEVAYENGKASFALPAQAGGATLVILQVPAWLNLKDEAPPQVTSARVDGEDLAPATEFSLGHRSQGLQSVRVSLKDSDNPVDAGAVGVFLDGVPLRPESVTVLGHEALDKSQCVEVALGDVPDGPHALVLRVPDAAAAPHTTMVSFTFTSGPLVKDGSFEELKADGSPVQWTTSMWSTDDKTKAELKVVEGGHTGRHCAELDGREGSLNLLFGQRVPLAPGHKYRVSLLYQASGAGGFLSMINDSQDEATKQYLSSAHLAAAQEWTAFQWEFGTKPSAGYTLYLRNAAPGLVRYDDVVLDDLGPEK
jgi:hypothetical protein